MTAELRRRLAVLVIGIAATLMALTVATWRRQDACLDAGGRWLAATRTCEAAAGATGPGSDVRGYLVGAVAGALVGFVLWRAFGFFVARAARRSG